MDEVEQDDSHKQRRLRPLLQAYYATPNDPCDVDSPSFDVSEYFESFIRTREFSDVKRYSGELAHEVHAIDDKMKNLVFENYNKFLQVSDTMVKVNGNVGRMLNDMEMLTKQVDRIIGESDSIDQKISTNKNLITQLNLKNTMLHKLHFLTTLPSRLKTAVEMGSYHQAAKYYAQSRNILDRHQHIPSFVSLREQCKVYTLEIEANLIDQMKTAQVSFQNTIEICQSLISIGTPAHVVSALYIQNRQEAITSQLALFHKRDRSDIVSTIRDLNRVFFMELLTASFQYKTLFPDSFNSEPTPKQQPLDAGCIVVSFDVSRAENGMAVVTDTLVKFVAQTFALLLDTVKKMLSDVQGLAGKIEALEVLYMDIQQVHRQMPELATESLDDIMLNCANDQISKHFDALQQKISAQNRNLLSVATGKEHSLLSQSTLFEENTSKFMAEIKTMLMDLQSVFMPTQTRFLKDHYGVLYSKILIKMQQFLLLLLGVEMDMNQGSATGEKSADLSSTYLLGMLHVCLFLEDEGLDKIEAELQTFAELVRGRIAEDNGETDAIAHAMFNTPDLLSRIRETAQGLITRYVSQHGKRMAKMVRKGVETPNWAKVKEPRDVRLVTELLMTEIYRAHVEIRNLFGIMPPSLFMRIASPLRTHTSQFLNVDQNQGLSEKQRSPSLPNMLAVSLRSTLSASPRMAHANPGRFSRSTSATLNAQMLVEPVHHRHTLSAATLSASILGHHKHTTSSTALLSAANTQSPTLVHSTLFETKILSTFAEPINCTIESVVIGILKLFLKSFVECVRLRTFGRYGYQQMQVDAAFMHAALIDVLADERQQLETLLGEAEAEVVERSTDALSMEPYIISTLVDAKLKRWKAALAAEDEKSAE